MDEFARPMELGWMEESPKSPMSAVQRSVLQVTGEQPSVIGEFVATC